MRASAHQRDLFTRRWRTVRALEPSELQLQISLVEWCRWKLRPDVLMWHTPNGEERDKRTAARLKAMGVLPGVADLQFLWREEVSRPPDAVGQSANVAAPGGRFRTRVLFLELKAPGRKPSAEQCGFALAVRCIGANYHIVDNIDEGIRIIESYSLTRKAVAYDADDDFARSINEGYRAIRERVKAGGPGWTPKEPTK
jgi:hypothetical protein